MGAFKCTQVSRCIQPLIFINVKRSIQQNLKKNKLTCFQTKRLIALEISYEIFTAAFAPQFFSKGPAIVHQSSSFTPLPWATSTPSPAWCEVMLYSKIMTYFMGKCFGSIHIRAPGFVYRIWSSPCSGISTTLVKICHPHSVSTQAFPYQKSM